MRYEHAAALAAQGCAFLGAFSSVAADALSGLDVPAFEAFACYAALGVVYAPLHWRACAASGTPLLSAPLAAYLLLACLDVEANYLIVSAFKFTSLTSVTLLDAAAVPAGLLLSRLLLSAAVTRAHAVAAAVVLLGTGVLVAGDVACGAPASSASAGAAPLLGDALTVAAACLFACSNALQERLLVDAPRTEVLALFGLLGTALSGLTAAVAEAPQLRAVAWDGATLAPLAGFVATVFVSYSIAPLAIAGCGSAAFNLHLLSSDVWAAAARALFFGGFGGRCSVASFVCAFGTVALGLLGFGAAGSAATRLRHHTVDSRDDSLVGVDAEAVRAEEAQHLIGTHELRSDRCLTAATENGSRQHMASTDSSGD